MVGTKAFGPSNVAGLATGIAGGVAAVAVHTLVTVTLVCSSALLSQRLLLDAGTGLAVMRQDAVLIASASVEAFEGILAYIGVAQSSTAIVTCTKTVARVIGVLHTIVAELRQADGGGGPQAACTRTIAGAVLRARGLGFKGTVTHGVLPRSDQDACAKTVALLAECALVFRIGAQ